MVDLVWLNKASILNFSFLGNLEVAQIYLSGWGGWVGGVTMILRPVSVLNWTELELDLN